MPHQPVIIVYGATAYTARALLPYLDEHPDGNDFGFILAGRNKSKLDAVNSKLHTKREVIAVTLEDAEGVKRLVAKGDLVMNLAGPFRPNNAEALIRECVETGKDYVDISAELTWLATTIIPKYDYLASKTGTRIIPCSGYDSVPSDLSVYHALRHLQSVKPGATIKKSTGFFKMVSTFSGGTVATLVDMASTPYSERGGEWSLISLGSSHHISPRLRFVYTLTNPSLPRTLVGGFWVMYPFNRCVVRRSWWLSQIPISSLNPSKILIEDGKEPRHGAELVYDEAMQLPNRVMAAFVSGGFYVLLMFFFASSLVRKFVQWMMPPGTGASMEELKKGSLVLTNLSVSDTFPPIEVKTTLYAEGDPAYISTCYTLAESALSLILPPPEGTSLPPLGQVGGVLTSSTGLGMVLVERLRKSGKLTIESEIVDQGAQGETRKNI